MQFRHVDSEVVAGVRKGLRGHQQLRSTILEVREAHEAGDRNAGEILNQFVQSLELSPVENWQTIPRWFAEQVIVSVLSVGLAYDNPMLSDDEASGLAARFLSVFREGAVFYSNGDDFSMSERDQSQGGITKATFDKGVVVVDGTRVGILWVMDED